MAAVTGVDDTRVTLLLWHREQGGAFASQSVGNSEPSVTVFSGSASEDKAGGGGAALALADREGGGPRVSSSAGLRAGGQGCVLTVGGPEAGLHGLPPRPVCAGTLWMTDRAQGSPCGLLSSAPAWDSTSRAAGTALRVSPGSGGRRSGVGGRCCVSSSSPSWPTDTRAPRPSQGVGTFSGVYPGEGANQSTPRPPISPTGNHLPGLHLHVRRTGQGSITHICGTQTLLPAPWAQHMLWPVTRPGLAGLSFLHVRPVERPAPGLFGHLAL